MSEQRLCINCIHHRLRGHVNHHMCAHPDFGTDLVTGEPNTQLCSSTRRDVPQAICGTEGAKYEASRNVMRRHVAADLDSAGGALVAKIHTTREVLLLARAEIKARAASCGEGILTARVMAELDKAIGGAA